MTQSDAIIDRQFSSFLSSPLGGSARSIISVGDYPLLEKRVDSRTQALTIYGYAVAGTQTDETGWLIYAIESGLSQSWTRFAIKNNVIQNGFTSIWDERLSCFPSMFTNTVSINFDGVDEHMLVNDTPSLNFGDQVTFNLWVKHDSAAASNQIILSRWGSGGDRSFYIQLSSAGFLSFVFTDNGSTAEVKSPAAAIPQDEWVMITVVLNATGQNIKIYYNGISKLDTSTTASTLYDSPEDMVFGGLSNGTLIANFYLGLIDEVSIFTSLLDSSDILDLYNSGTPKDITTMLISSDILAWYRMGDNDTFPTVGDLSANSNHATMVNMTTDNFVEDAP